MSKYDNISKINSGGRQSMIFDSIDIDLDLLFLCYLSESNFFTRSV